MAETLLLVEENDPGRPLQPSDVQVVQVHQPHAHNFSTGLYNFLSVSIPENNAITKDALNNRLIG